MLKAIGWTVYNKPSTYFGGRTTYRRVEAVLYKFGYKEENLERGEKNNFIQYFSLHQIFANLFKIKKLLLQAFVMHASLLILMFMFFSEVV